MAYSKKIIAKAEALYVNDGLSPRKIATKLKIKRWQTVQSWVKQHGWEAKRVKIESEASQLAEEKAIQELAKDKSEYRKENLKILDHQKANLLACSQYLAQKITDTKGAVIMNSEVRKALRTVEQCMVPVIKTQDDILFNKNKVDFEGEMKIHADVVYQTVLNELEQSDNS